MSHVVSSSAPIGGAHTVKKYAGFGIKGADIPSSGDSGGSPVLNDGILGTSEYYWRLETTPGSGTLTLYPDLSFEHYGAADGSWAWQYRLYWVDADGTVGDGTATVTDIFGSGAVALLIDRANHGHAVDAVAMTTQWLLSVADALHAHTTDNATLSTYSTYSLAVADGLHLHLADQITLSGTASYTLAIADSAHAQIADGLTLGTTSAYTLVTADSSHAHLADGVVLGTVSVWGLIVADSLHAHAADGLGLSTVGSASLAIADAAHPHASDPIILATQWVLSIAEAIHAHAADGLLLTPTGTASLILQEALHDHSADSLGLSSEAWLAVVEAVHAHYADVAVLSFPSTGTGGPLSQADIDAIATAVWAKMLGARSAGAHMQVQSAVLAGDSAGAGTTHMAYTDGSVTVEADVPLPGQVGNRTNTVVSGV